MISSTPVYISKIQRNIGVMSVRRAPFVRQDFAAKASAAKIQAVWKEYSHVDMPPSFNSADGVFSSWYGFYPNACATKLQALVRGHQARVGVPMVRMSKWIADNVLAEI